MFLETSRGDEVLEVDLAELRDLRGVVLDSVVFDESEYTLGVLALSVVH